MEDISNPQLIERLESLEKENAALKEQNRTLAEEKADLEMLMEMSADHADEVGQELLDKANAFKEVSNVILETVPIPILVTRLSDSRALYVNSQMAVLLGWEREKLMGRKALDFLYQNPFDRTHVLDALEKDGVLNDFEMEGKRADGRPFTVRVFGRTMMFENESCILTAYYDETGRKRAEAEIIRLEEELERRKKAVWKYLAFTLCGERYGILLSMIREITQTDAVTRVPNAPEFVRGVMNLRGRVIPVIDMGLRLGLGRCQESEENCVIVAELGDDRGHIHVGLVVDAVSEVMSVRGEDIKDMPPIRSIHDSHSVFRIASSDGEIILLTDIRLLLDKTALSRLSS